MRHIRIIQSRLCLITQSYASIASMETNVERWLTYRWQKGNRYYVAELTQDLFGAWRLKWTWGRLPIHRGQSMTLCADNYAPLSSHPFVSLAPG